MERKPTKLKPFFLLLLAWVVVVALAIGGSIFYNAYQGSRYEATAFPFIEKVIPEIAAWNADRTRALLAPETVATLPEGNIAKAMEVFSRLGTLEEVGEPEYEETVELPGDGGAETTLVTYTVPTRFSSGPAEFKLQLVDRGDRFQLYNFHLSSEFLAGPAE